MFSYFYNLQRMCEKHVDTNVLKCFDYSVYNLTNYKAVQTAALDSNLRYNCLKLQIRQAWQQQIQIDKLRPFKNILNLDFCW